jgi:hypothetical protein
VEFGARLDESTVETTVFSFQPMGLEQALVTRDLIAGTLDLFYELRPGIDISGCLPLLMLVFGALGTIAAGLFFWLAG